MNKVKQLEEIENTFKEIDAVLDPNKSLVSNSDFLTMQQLNATISNYDSGISLDTNNVITNRMEPEEFVLPNVRPACPITGQMYVDPGLDELWIYMYSEWKKVNLS